MRVFVCLIVCVIVCAFDCLCGCLFDGLMVWCVALFVCLLFDGLVCCVAVLSFGWFVVLLL